MKHAEAGWIGGASALRIVARFGVDARVQPIAAQRRAVILKLTESVELLARRLENLRRIFGIFDVSECLATHLFEDFAEIGVHRMAV